DLPPGAGARSGRRRRAGMSTPRSEPAVALRDLHHQFKDLVAVDGLTFDVRSGETAGLLGPNGSGKSTVLSLLAGRLQVQRGEVKVFGERLPGGVRRVAPRIGVIFQSPALDPQLSARENLSLTGQMYGIGGA